MTAGEPFSVYLVGAGRMGGALLQGWLACGLRSDKIFVNEPCPTAEIAELLQTHSLAAVPSAPPAVMVFAVKPQALDEVLAENAALAGPDTVVLSVAAGRTIASIARFFPSETAIVRAMPNLPAEIGRGITALYANAAAGERHKEICESLARAVGEVVWLDEEAHMDAVTAVSGSGPAYVFALAEQLEEAARAAGLPAPLAAKLARATVTGAGELLFRSELSPAQLRENVTSPAGTTAAGLSVLLKDGGLNDLLTKTVAAAAARSKELSK